MARRIHMGTLARPHGIKGEICVDWYADSPSLLDGSFDFQGKQFFAGVQIYLF